MTHTHICYEFPSRVSQVAAVVAKAKDLMSSKATDVEVRQLVHLNRHGMQDFNRAKYGIQDWGQIITDSTDTSKSL